MRHPHNAATNAVYAGRATARTVKLLPDGTVFHDRTAQKIRRREQGHEYATTQLVALGAPRPRPGCDPAVWLRDALVAVGARNIRHRGTHRFVFRLGRTRKEREEIELGLTALRPYPKQPDPEPAPVGPALRAEEAVQGARPGAPDRRGLCQGCAAPH